MELTAKAKALQAMLDYMCVETFEKYKKWFSDNFKEPFCYWSKDEPIKIADKDNKDLLAKHPEIEDINDHTIVRYNPQTEKLVLSDFCPRLREGLSELYRAGFGEHVIYGMHWCVEPDIDKDGNYTLTVEKE